MKKYFTVMVLLISIVSCKKEEVKTGNGDTSPKDGMLSISVKNMVGNEDIVYSDMRYTNAAGNAYSVSLLKYYISNIILHKKDGGNVQISVYKLIDAAQAASCIFQAGTLMAGAYDSMTLHIGVDPSRNHTGVQDGDLDVSKGMFWTWNTGYIFFKHEGQYKNSSMQNKSLLLHLGTDLAYSESKFPIDLNIDGNKTMEIKMDLNSVYSSPVNIDFNIDNNRQSFTSADNPWIANMKSNFYDAFSFIKVY